MASRGPVSISARLLHRYGISAIACEDANSPIASSGIEAASICVLRKIPKNRIAGDEASRKVFRNTGQNLTGDAAQKRVANLVQAICDVAGVKCGALRVRLRMPAAAGRPRGRLPGPEARAMTRATATTDR